MSRHLLLTEGETVRLDLPGDTIGQIRAMEGLYPDAFVLDERPDGIRFTPVMIGHYGFRDGTEIDIVPRMPDESVASERTLMRMMYTIFNMKGSSDGMNLFEFFVKVFVREVNTLLRKGMRSAYTQVQGNETVFKGRLMVSDNIRENLVHKERVYVEYELFTPDRPENRVIKSTLEVLVKRSCDDRNLRDIKVLLSGLEDIPSSPDIQRDLSACRIDRNMADYVSPLMWCSVFAGGNNGSFALLMDPEQVFDAFVARCSVRGKDGSFSVRNIIRTLSDEVSISLITLKWVFRRTDGMEISDSYRLFRSASGYAIFPERDCPFSLTRFVCLDLIQSMWV